MGSGRKVSVDDRPVAADEVSLLDIGGDIHPGEVKLFLLERRESDAGNSLIGEIVWRPVSPDHFMGRFEVDVGDTRGSSEAFREPPTHTDQ